MFRIGNPEDTICAISTPLGEGGIGIVRLSGPDAFNIVSRIFHCSRKADSSFPESRYLYHGYIGDSGDYIDEVLVSFMPAPKTYTCEDVVEINCHSGVVALRAVLKKVLESGARLAEPGEFTKRAFLKGRIDLSQAEAVMGIIRAKSDEAARIAVRTMSGELAERIAQIRDRITSIRAPLEASFDYPEEFDGEEVERESLKDSISELQNELEGLLEGVERNRVYQEGISIAIIGKPNVGKSSLLNILLRQDKAIVHDLPGTTRDMLEGFISIGGYPLRVIDTAGIQGTDDPVEKEGINRSRAAASMARMLLVVFDGSVSLADEDKEIAALRKPDQGLVVVINKNDLPQKITIEEVKGIFGDIAVVETAAINNQGIKQLENAVIEQLDQLLDSAGESSLIVSVRHEDVIRDALKTAQEALVAADNQPYEMISLELQETWNKLGEITGETVNDDLLDKIFSQFCLGK